LLISWSFQSIRPYSRSTRERIIAALTRVPSRSLWNAWEVMALNCGVLMLGTWLMMAVL
jgi:hypothetical protein